MTNEEAIAILELKTMAPGDGYTWEQIEEAINVAVDALKANQVGSEPLKYEQLRKMDGQVVKQVIHEAGKIYENLLLVNTYDKDCVWLFDAYFHSAPYHNDDEFEEEGFTIYPYNPARIDREAWTAEWKEYTGADAGFHYCSECKQQAFNYEDGGEIVEVLSDFCPSCGKAMTPEAWEMLKKRLMG